MFGKFRKALPVLMLVMVVLLVVLISTWNPSTELEDETIHSIEKQQSNDSEPKKDSDSVPESQSSDLEGVSDSNDLGATTPNSRDKTGIVPTSSVMQDMLRAIETEDVDLAIGATLKLLQCRNFARTESRLDERANAYQQALSDASVRNMTEEWVAEAIGREQNRTAECNEALADADELFVDGVTNQALNGNAIARYIYAMWEHDDTASILMAGPEIEEFETRALRFTQENISDGHPLGLLAMGLSYLNGMHFTAERASLGAAYLLASQLCGIENAIVSRSLAQYYRRKESALASMVESLADDSIVNAAALKLYEDSCGKDFGELR